MSDYAQEVTKVYKLVACATDESLTEPHWALNMEICDCANAYDAVCDDIVRFLQHRLQRGQPKVALWTLILIETVVKNGPPAIHSRVGAREFLDEIVALSVGSLDVDVRNQALMLIRQWAEVFKDSELQTFQDVYTELKLQGVEFPAVESEVPFFTPPPSATKLVSPSGRDESSQLSGAAAPGKRTREQQIEKLHADLEVVQQKIKLLKDLFAGDQTTDELDDILDFLHQCQPRMNTLIEGGIMGKIDESTLDMCLNVNDHLMKTLEECRKTQVKHMMASDSPSRVCHRTELEQSLAQLSLDHGTRAPGSAAVASARPVASATMLDEDAMSYMLE
ncbi:hypothetical protein PsorP6_005536 [Peronosclerospora sorghi]|uniref:Uncharacterized protein n=1 Tax=Peronosclerospora sorghi TaxID=230839 RepID=A0ACC0W2X3_9STRA|nr:hypothetical protein PsorP6_005536 [Peronosclerospora sorghi]